MVSFRVPTFLPKESCSSWRSKVSHLLLSVQSQRLGGLREDGPWHHHSVGSRSFLRLARGLRRVAQHPADRVPAVLRQPHLALLGHPRGGVHTQSHRLQLPLQMHYGKYLNLGIIDKYTVFLMGLIAVCRWASAWLIRTSTPSGTAKAVSTQLVCVERREEPSPGSLLQPPWVFIHCKSYFSQLWTFLCHYMKLFNLPESRTLIILKMFWTWVKELNTFTTVMWIFYQKPGLASD